MMSWKKENTDLYDGLTPIFTYNTTASDGELSLDDVVTLYGEKGFDAIAIIAISVAV
jgi:hypothetical protein